MRACVLGFTCLLIATADDLADEAPVNVPLCNVCDQRGITDPILGADVAGFGTVREAKELGRGKIKLKVKVTSSLRNAERMPKVDEVLELVTQDHGKKFTKSDEVLLLGHTTSAAIWWHFPYSIDAKGKTDIQFVFDHPISNAMDSEAVEGWLTLALNLDRPLSLWAADKLKETSNDFWRTREHLIDCDQFRSKISEMQPNNPASMKLCRIAVMSGNKAFGEFVRARYELLGKDEFGFFPDDLIIACLIAGGEDALSDFETKFFGPVDIPNQIHHWDSQGGPLLRAVVSLNHYQQGSFSMTRIGESISRLLDERVAADLAITALRDIKCWNHGKQISELWRTEGFTSLSVENSIIRYMAACRDDTQSTDKAAVQFASDWLARINEDSPELILRALR